MDARSFVLTLMAAFPLIAACAVLWGGLRLKSLLARVPRIATRGDLELYEKEHRLHGMLATLNKALMGISNVLFVIDLFILGGPMSDLFYAVVPCLVCLAVSLPFRAVDQRANELDCAPEFQKDFFALKD